MNLRTLFYVAAGAVLAWAAWRAYGGMGVVIFATGVVTWLLLHFTRMMHVLKKAADRPKGYVASAVMLNAKLKPKVNLLHVMAMTNSLGEPLGPEGGLAEVFRWTDGGGSHVTCEFENGKLVKWTLWRPPEAAAGAAAPAP